MVTVSNYALRVRKDGSTFVVLELTGGLEIIQSSNTGKHYATVRKCTIPSTFSEEVAKLMDIQVMDHLILADGGYFSFSDEGIM
jgi:hypothetical protein